MIFSLLDYQGGIDGFIGIIFFQPIMGVMSSLFTIIVCLIVGLPIRLNKRIKKWWNNRFYIAFGGVICGLTFIIISLIPDLMTTIITQNGDQEVLKKIPNLYLIVGGWFIMAFSTLHLFPPTFLVRRFVNVIKRLK